MAGAKLKNLRRTLRLDGVQDHLEDASDEAASSRIVLRSAFAKAYVWYQRALALKRSYLEETFKAEPPSVTTKKGVSEFIDDDEAVRGLVRDALVEEGYKVHTAKKGGAGWSLYERSLSVCFERKINDCSG